MVFNFAKSVCIRSYASCSAATFAISFMHTSSTAAKFLNLRLGVDLIHKEEGFSQVRSSMGDNMLPYLPLPIHSKGDWLMILWMSLISEGHWAADSFHSERMDFTIRSTFLHSRLTVQFVKRLYGVMNGCLILDYFVKISITDAVKGDLWSVTNHSMHLKRAIHHDNMLMAVSLSAVAHI